MDVQLQDLIEKIKKDGVEAADKSASEKIAQAKAEAEKIIANAKEEADKIIKAAKDETARMEKASEDAIRQAGRNLILSFRESVEKELSAIMTAETAKSYSPKLLENLIPETVKAWTKNTDASDVSVLLNEKDLKELEQNLGAALKDEISKGLTLKADNSIENGFRIGVKDGAAYYDFSAEAVADLFSAYLNPKVASIMKEAVKA
ncbi:MAG: V-type ATP synthase subunit E [Treponema sp.]|nr:V-type ATP synthase subunit E [Treponema sp.]